MSTTSTEWSKADMDITSLAPRNGRRISCGGWRTNDERRNDTRRSNGNSGNQTSRGKSPGKKRQGGHPLAKGYMGQ